MTRCRIILPLQGGAEFVPGACCSLFLLVPRGFLPVTTRAGRRGAVPSETAVPGPGRWVRRRYTARSGFLRPGPRNGVEVYDPQGEPHDLCTALAALEEGDARACAAFCCRWGLLGLLQHRAS